MFNAFICSAPSPKPDAMKDPKVHGPRSLDTKLTRKAAYAAETAKTSTWQCQKTDANTKQAREARNELKLSITTLSSTAVDTVLTIMTPLLP
jgi:hypothetical protein